MGWGGGGGGRGNLAICQLSVKFWAIYQLSVNWLLTINYASYFFFTQIV